MINTALFKEKLPAWYSPDGGSDKQNTKELLSIVHYSNAVQGWLSEAQGMHYIKWLSGR